MIHQRHSLEDHERDMPNCSDPDCEFHHPEVREDIQLIADGPGDGMSAPDNPDFEDDGLCDKWIPIGVEDSAHCDQPFRHYTPHEGPCSLGGRASWLGGGYYIEGDLVPVRGLKLLTDPTTWAERTNRMPD